MRNEGQKPQGAVPRSGRNNGIIPTSFRALSSYLRIVSSGASSVASTVRSAASAASAIVERESDAGHDQVLWAGFDILEWDGGINRQVLLLGYRFGFQVWDVEEADNVRDLVSRHDGPVTFMQVLPKLLASKRCGDRFADSRPLLAVCADGSVSGGGNFQDAFATSLNGSSSNGHDPVNGGFMPTVVRFYSLRSQSYVHILKFRSAVYSVRCSTRVIAISQAAQINCFDAATLEREYTLLTNPLVTGCSGFGGIGCGPLAVGPRWLAYSGSPVVNSNPGRVSPQHLTPSASFSGPTSNGSLVAHYAKQSSKQLAAGIVTLGDMGYKKLSRYYSELLPECNNAAQLGNPGWKVNGTVNGHLPDAENVGMVIVRDIVSKSVIAQFRAHKSPISSLCFDPSGILLVTASVQGHNINVFRIMPGLWGSSSGSDSSPSYVHLYRLQRGFTNAVIQDISFSDDSNWIMISSSRGTSHLFAISPSGGFVTFQSPDACFTGKNCGSGPPVTLSVVSRIRSGNNGWRSTVSGAAAAATGRTNSLSGAIASAFHNCKGNDLHAGTSSLKALYHLLVFSPSGCVIQYALRASPGLESAAVVAGLGSYNSAPENDARLVVEAIQKWNISQKQNRREREENIDIYGENGNLDSSKIFPEGIEKENCGYTEVRGSIAKPKVSPEERYHLFISEAELQMHEARIPLWAKPEIYFQSMIMDGVPIDGEATSGGEIEIERIPTRMIEARSKDLVPIFEYLQTPKFQQTRIPALNSSSDKRLLHQTSGPSEDGGFPCRSSSGSLDSMTDGGAAVAELHGRIEETSWDGIPMPKETTKGFVNNNDYPKSNTRLEIVNNRDSSTREAHAKFVNNNIEGPKMENQFEDEGDEFD
ncbi:autophagy-related protein 18f-like isoform X2 [Actinidia eriantha]|uniref:autophagy-related protein 18f-like isoform X2 n=1 Tax=Actinidia eriantha TaxID=165200 RepID=UPI00258D1836|nr:autophagy-related protein 18f-like isoform X2 [Actinidia eriantha]